jgi:hypothetical protein
MGLYSQYFISCITNEWAQRARVLHYTRLEMLARTKKLKLIWPIHKLHRKYSVVNRVPGAAFTTLIFFLTYEWAQQVRVLHLLH